MLLSTCLFVFLPNKIIFDGKTGFPIDDLLSFIKLDKNYFMKIKLLFCLLMVFCFFSVPGQQLYTFSGKITNAGTVPLAGTSVYLLNTNRGASYR